MPAAEPVSTERPDLEGSGRGSGADRVFKIVALGAGLTVLDGGPRLPASTSAWAALAFLGLVASALAFTVQTWAQAQMSATRTAVIMTSEPLWAGIFAVIVAGEPAGGRLLVGGSLVVLAMYVVELGPRWADRRAAPRVWTRGIAPSNA